MIRMDPLGGMHCLSQGWEFQPEDTSVPGTALHFYVSSMLADDAVADGQAQSGAPVLGFSGEKGIEDLAEMVGRNAYAGVAHLGAHHRVLALGHQGQLTAFRHG